MGSNPIEGTKFLSMTIEEIDIQLKALHVEEDKLNKSISWIDGKLKGLSHEKKILARKVSTYMKARNWLINKKALVSQQEQRN